MRTVAAVGVIVGMMFLAASAAAQQWIPAPVDVPACPAGMPVQNIHVINQANVRADRLALVERAAVLQSLQVRRWWGTPCVQFAQDGWRLWLKRGADDSTTGVHYWRQKIFVWTGGLNYEMWSAMFTHEIVETLVDPETQTDYIVHDTGYQIEIADPVEHRTYRLAGVNVTDFVTPNWYAGAQTGECETDLDGIHCNGPLIAPAGAPAPYDQTRVLSRAWQVDSLYGLYK